MITPQNGDAYQWFMALGKWAIYIVVGIAGKVSYELTLQRKLSLIEWIAVIGISVFVGYICMVWCVQNGFETQAAYIVPVATLLGEKAAAYVTDNFRSIITRIFETIVKPKKLSTNLNLLTASRNQNSLSSCAIRSNLLRVTYLK